MLITSSTIWLPLSIILGAFISEDAATLTAATLAASRILDWHVAFASAFLGIWTSDIALYAAARMARTRFSNARWMQWCAKVSGSASRTSLQRWGSSALLLSRLIPGTRLPATVAAGLIEMPLLSFVGTTALGAFVWITLNFTVVKSVGTHRRNQLLVAFAVFIVTIALGWAVRKARIRNQFAIAFRRWSRWEFWPAWLFYPPVALMCAWLAVRYRGLSLPAIANPSQLNGGMVGESKYDILQALRRAAPGFVAPTHLIPAGTLLERMARLQTILATGEIAYPLVLKPDVGQRGAAFKKIESCFEALPYLATVRTPVVVQRYIPGPHEAGIFYYRFPSEERGRILAITDKRFPHVVGNGKHTLEQLIRADERASLIADIYLNRFGDRCAIVPASGERVRLVEAGNHCQGCIFHDGSHLYSEPLRAAIDVISQELEGFYVGRYDIRYSSAEELRDGQGFTIIELNGAASEATSIYDPANSLWSAYRTLFEQWRIVYAIGAENRRRGFAPPSAASVLRAWLSYQADAAAYPAAD